MKTYGKPRKEYANRKKRGTSMACLCCIPRKAHIGGKFNKARARRDAKRFIKEQS